MELEPIVAPSAFKHGVAEQDMLHACRTPFWVTPGDEGFTMITGPSRSGGLLEVGVVRADDGTPVIVHAQPARRRFLPGR
jgi:hypothetical protein